MAGHDSTQSETETANVSDDAEEFRAELRHPLFDSADPPSALDCLDAIDRTACVIDLLSYLDLGSDTSEGLSSRAAAGHGWLLEMMRDTLNYTSRRLGSLSRKQHEKARTKARDVSALLSSLSTLAEADRDSVLNAMALKLQVTRSDADMFIDNAMAECDCS